MRIAIVNGAVVTAGGVLPAATIDIAGGRIAAIETAAAGDADAHLDLDGGWLVPGFVDAQVNGGGGVLFNDRPSVEGMVAIAEAHRAFGTTALAPTLVSETVEVIAEALDSLDSAIEQGAEGIVGVHVEGPMLNPARNGTHDRDRLRPIGPDLAEVLTKRRRGRVMVTLAPEMVSPADIAGLVAAGVIVSAGHSEADAATVRAALDAGMTGVTHLFNAMPPLRQREPGVVGVTLDDPRPWSGLIVDGVHVAPEVLRLARKARPLDRLMLVTDAMSSVGAAEKNFTLHGQPIEVRDGICRNPDGTLAGSDLDMASAFANACAMMRVSPPEAAAMAATNPAAFLGLGATHGSIALGARADWVVLDAALGLRETWLAGRRVAP
ncbi:N-acetylglucosamine-6-phosphate deacetylase [Sphingomonas sp. ASV193]|uniref:N-acetylglucosamine-6-phosphate deacetylase n=1 Tax=Sphingomonas sp. ASV193 TaxID=3144405 RepID=UPI0032E91AA9